MTNSLDYRPFSALRCQVADPLDGGRIDEVVIAILPLPPSVNHVWRHGISRTDGRSVVYKTPEYVRWQRQAHAILRAITPWTYPRPRQRWESVVEVYFPDWRADVDNISKALLDTCCAALGFKDNYCLDLHLKRRIDKGHPRVEISIQWHPMISKKNTSDRAKSPNSTT